jgi:hypothetical protein
MGDTYDSAAEAAADRNQQKALLAALGAWDRALRRDECGTWTISGTRGTVHTWGDTKTWVLYVACRSARHWTATKEKLPFCTVTQDGDEEGCLRLNQLPTPGQATVIRDILGIRKKQEVSATALERLKAFAFGRKPRSEPNLEQNVGHLGARPPAASYPDQTPILDAEPAKFPEVQDRSP